MSSPGNQHGANCIGTLSFPIRILMYNENNVCFSK